MVKKLWQYVKPFSSNTGHGRTDISILRVSVLTRDKKRNDPGKLKFQQTWTNLDNFW